MSNLHQFNRCAALILARLYRNFPVAGDLKLEEHRSMPNAVADDIFFATLSFLGEEGFVRYKRQSYQGFEAVVLTARGLKALNVRPDKEEARPVGELMADKDAPHDRLMTTVLAHAD